MFRFVLFLRGLIICAVSITCDAYQAYDCTHPTFSGYQSTLVSKSCDELQSQDLEEMDTYGTILQQSLTKQASAKVCKRMTVEREVYCNWMIVAEAKVDPVNVQGFQGAPLTVSECLQAFQHGFVQEGFKKIKVNQGTRVIYTDTHKLTNDGLCTKWHGNVRFKTYFLELTTSNITMTSGVDSQVDTYMIDGFLLKKSPDDNSGITDEGHTVIWDADEHTNCFLNQLYQGPVSIVSDDVHTQQVLIKSKGVGMSLGDEVVLCNVYLTSTNIPFVYYVGHNGTAFPSLTDPTNVQLFAESKVMIQGLMTSTALESSKTSTEIRRSICELEQKVNRDVLDSLHTDPDSAAFKQLGVKGWRMVKAGAAAGLLKCKSISVKIYPQTQCFLDVPVFLGEDLDLQFMDALTGVVHATSMSIPCDDPRIPLLKIDTQWFRVGTSVTPVADPSPFAGFLTQQSKTRLKTATNLASELLIKKKMVAMTVEAAKRNGQLKLTALQSDSLSHYTYGDETADGITKLPDSMSQFHLRNVLAFAVPVTLLTVLSTLLYVCRGPITRLAVNHAIPDVERLRQYLPPPE